jgi:hypothetical protein
MGKNIIFPMHMELNMNIPNSDWVSNEGFSIAIKYLNCAGAALLLKLNRFVVIFLEK